MDIEQNPLGYDVSRKDWNVAFAGREMTIDDWNRLTLGEQAHYATQELSESGVAYTAKFTGSQLDLSISLPSSVSDQQLTADDIRHLESFIRRKLEEQITAILQLRRMSVRA